MKANATFEGGLSKSTRWILVLALLILAVLPVFQFSANLGFDDKTGYLASSAAMNPFHIDRYRQVMQRRPELEQRCNADRRCVLRIDGRLASLLNYPLQSSLLLFSDKLVSLIQKHRCSVLSISVFLSFFFQSCLMGLGFLLLALKAPTRRDFEICFVFLLAAVLALYVFNRDINFTSLNGKASGAVGFLCILISCAYVQNRKLCFLAGLLLLPLVHLGQAVFLTFFFMLLSGVEFLRERNRTSLWGAIAGFSGFVVCLAFCSFAMKVTTSGTFSALDIFTNFLQITPSHIWAESSFSRLAGILFSSSLLLYLGVQKTKVLHLQWIASQRFWDLVGTATLYLWGVFVFHLSISSLSKLGGANLATGEFFDRVNGNLEFLPLALLLMVILKAIENKAKIRTWLDRYEGIKNPLAPLALLGILVILAGSGSLFRFVKHIPLSLIANKDETCRVMDIEDLQNRIKRAGDWVPVFTPGNEPEFHMVLFLYLTEGA